MKKAFVIITAVMIMFSSLACAGVDGTGNDGEGPEDGTGFGSGQTNV